MLGQLSLAPDGHLRDKVEAAISRLRMFEPEEGYYLAFSGGKDSQCVYHLAKKAGVKFDAHYAVTSVDPPELVQFIKANYPDAWEGREHQYNDGKPLTMWNLISAHSIPPSRNVRYCCKDLKETGGMGRLTVTGVRWAESPNRKNNHGAVDIQKLSNTAKQVIDEIGADYRMSKQGGAILNDDNDEARRAVEHCYRTRKTLVNPIVDWEDEDV